MAIPVEEPVAERKAVRKQIKALKRVASTGQLDAAGAAQLKALKTQAKALKRAESQASMPGGCSDAEAAGAKDGKRAKKQKRGAAAEQPAEQPPAKKKQKHAAAAAAVAAVGDRGLATSRPAVVKALYHEQADVAAMSAKAVAAWRKERKTKVEGNPLHPISSFAQSGERPATDCMPAVRKCQPR